MSRLECNRLKWLPLIMTLIIVISIALPYFTSVGLEHLDPFIPYINHAAAFAPQSAFLSIFMTISAPLAIVIFTLRYVIVDHRKGLIEDRTIPILNCVSLVFGLCSILSMIYISHNPLGFVQSDHDWVRSVVVPHLTGTVLLFICYTSYVLSQAYLTFKLKGVNSRNVFTHGTISMFVVLSCWTTCIPFYAALGDIVPNIIHPDTGAVNLHWTKYGFYYIISSLSGWGFIFFSVLFVATFYKDFQSTSLKLELRPKVPELIREASIPRRSLHGLEVTKM